jgi:phosphohistidine phosphatase SixA
VAAASRARALADPTRLSLAASLRDGGELCVCDLAWISGRPQNLVSHHLRALYAASSDRLLERIRAVPDEVATLMRIGHNPGLHDLALLHATAGAELERLKTRFPTAALATLTLTRSWRQHSQADAVLTAYVVPKQLR